MREAQTKKKKKSKEESKIKIPREVATGDGDCWRGCGREVSQLVLTFKQNMLSWGKKDKSLLNILCKI